MPPNSKQFGPSPPATTLSEPPARPGAVQKGNAQAKTPCSPFVLRRGLSSNPPTPSCNERSEAPNTPPPWGRTFGGGAFCGGTLDWTFHPEISRPHSRGPGDASHGSPRTQTEKARPRFRAACCSSTSGLFLDRGPCEDGTQGGLNHVGGQQRSPLIEPTSWSQQRQCLMWADSWWDQSLNTGKRPSV